MNINPNYTEQVSKVSVDKNKNSSDVVQDQSNYIKDVVVEAPIMNLASVMPKDKVTVHDNGDEDFDVEKAINEFNDIKDTKTISKICKVWKKDLDSLLTTFSSENIKMMKDPHLQHLEAIGKINTKYDKFVQKISDIMENDSNESSDDVNIVFDEYISPMVMHAQEVFRQVDNQPEIAGVYRDRADSIIAVKNGLENATTMEDIQAVIPHIEKLQETNKDYYETAMALMETRINEILAGDVQPENDESGSNREIEKKSKESSVKDYQKMDAKRLCKEIEKLTEKDLMSDKFSGINDALTIMSKNNPKEYAKLNETFNAKLVELSDKL